MSSRKAPPSGRPGVPSWHKDKTTSSNEAHVTSGGRPRSNSRSQVVNAPSFLAPEPSMDPTLRRTLPNGQKTAKQGVERPQKRPQAEFYVTLSSLNDTFATKHVHVPFYPETCKLGRPTGTKVKPHVTNGYFDSRVLSRNHACMYIDPKSGSLMVQDMGSSNGTFVNSAKLAAEPVCVKAGDTINLGFNIQVETNHKQISARVENINVVSNSPQGAVSSLLPRLTKSALGNFTEADMHHYEFIQGLCSQLASDSEKAAAEDAGETDSKSQAVKAFDHGMYSDIVPSLDEIFESSANQQIDDAGIYRNSGLQTSRELFSTLDYLSANLAKVKQQNSVLASLEVFFSNYIARVDEINTKHVERQIQTFEAESSAKTSQERERTAQKIQDQESKLSAQARLVSTLEAEIVKLKEEAFSAARKEVLLSRPDKQSPENEPSRSESEFNFTSGNTHDAPLSNDNHTRTEDLDNKTNNPILKNAGASDSKPRNNVRGLLEQTENEEYSVDRSQNKTEGTYERSAESNNTLDAHKATPSAANSLKPYVDHLHHALEPYKNQGVVVGFLVVVAGFIYQSSKSS